MLTAVIDGYTALLSQSNGGTLEEVVSEEEGMLISTILRQYFLSLRVICGWKRKNWSPSLNKLWDGIHEELHIHHPVMEPKTSIADEEINSQTRTTSSSAGVHRAEEYKPKSGLMVSSADVEFVFSDTEDERVNMKPIRKAGTGRENELTIMRKVTRKWWRLAGLKGHPSLADPWREGEFGANWTRVQISALFIYLTTAYIRYRQLLPN